MGVDGRGQVITAKAYRLLRTILNTAVEDGLIPSNPCKIKGAARSAHRNDRRSMSAKVFSRGGHRGPVARPGPPRRLAHLRWGELAALRRHCLNLDARTVQVRASQAEVGSKLILGPPSPKQASERSRSRR